MSPVTTPCIYDETVDFDSLEHHERLHREVIDLRKQLKGAVELTEGFRDMSKKLEFENQRLMKDLTEAIDQANFYRGQLEGRRT